jgi:glutamate synthase (NADPH/NADH) large chain
LCRAAYERDSCGFGLIASLDDQASHWVVQTAISSLNRLTHRGAIAADGKTGDGCGLLIKSRPLSARGRCEAGFKLAPLFAAGLVFLNRDPALAAQARARADRTAAARETEGRRLSFPAHGPRAPAAWRRSRRCRPSSRCS